MEQQHANSTPVHQISTTSPAPSENNSVGVIRRRSSTVIQSPLITASSPSIGKTISNTKRTSIHLEDRDQQSRVKRVKQSLEMEEFKLDGSENSKPQPPSATSTSQTPVVSSPVVHDPPTQPSCSSDAETTIPVTSKTMRARSMSAPAVGHQLPNTVCCRKSTTALKSKKSLNEPPVNLITLKELDLKEILNNPRLRHDIYFDAALHFRPNLDGQRGQKKKAQADNYWENIVRECENVRRNQIGLQRGVTSRLQPKRLMLLLDTMRDILLSLVPTRDQKTVEQVFDQQLMMQQLEYGLLNFEGLATWLAGLLKAHCAPMRDAWVDDMVSKIKDGVTRDSPRSLVDGLRSVFGILEAMKLDVANHQIRTLRPYLVSTAAEFEREHFQKRIQKGTLCVSETQDWFHQLAAKQKSNMDAPDYLAILTAGVLERLSPSKPHTKPPATFTFDLERLEAIRFDIKEDVNLKTCLLLFRSLVSGLNKTLEVDKDAYTNLSAAIQAINGDDEISERWQRNSPALALQIAQSATTFATGKPNSKSFPDSNLVKFAENWLGQHLRPQSALYQSFEQKVIEAIALRTQIILKAWTHHKPPNFQQIPDTVMGLPADFASLPQRLAKIINLHWRVFEKLYISAATTPISAHKGDVALSASHSDSTSSETSDAVPISKKKVPHNLADVSFQHLERKGLM
ncbi:hypothetical protein AA313_de0208888 [Arthrobotrys entomopaga]|nr:hypothetical protein AA313_de0208888 [Arthrobotrys entomopaga]